MAAFLEDLRDGQARPAGAQAGSPAAPEAPVPPLRVSLRRALESALKLTLGAALCVGSWGLMRGTFDGVLGVPYGEDATVGLLAAELALGHMAGPRLIARKRDWWTKILCALLVAALTCEVTLSFVREDVLHAQHVREAHKAAAQLVPKPCQVQQPPREDVPPDLAGDRREEARWRADKRRRDDAWYAAQRQQCQEDASRQTAQADSETDDLVRAADTHNPLEPYLFALLALVMGGTTIAAGTAASPFLRALLDIPCAILAGIASLLPRCPPEGNAASRFGGGYCTRPRRMPLPHQRSCVH
jgi:hypothetical protein